MVINQILTAKEITQEILKELKDSPPGFDSDAKLIELTLRQWELHIRLDQNQKNFEMTMKSIKESEEKANGTIFIPRQ